MALSSFSMAVISSTQFSGFKKSSDTQLIPRLVRPFQVKCKGNSELEIPNGLSFTRRNAMICLTTLSVSTTGASSLPEIAGANPEKKDEMKQKIKEKLETLRDKAYNSKNKITGNKEEVIPPETPPFPLPNPPQGFEKSLVEPTLYNRK